MSETVEDWELSAFVDGDLPEGRRREIEAIARKSPEVRRKLEDYLALHRLLATAAWDAADPVQIPRPTMAIAGRLARRLSGQRDGSGVADWFVRSLRQAGLVLAGGALGWAAASFADMPLDSSATFVDEATEIHRVLTVAPSFATESSKVDLAQLDQLFAFRAALPDLTDMGLALRRIDVSPTDDGPVLVFLFEDDGHRLVSLIMSTNGRSLAAVGEASNGVRVVSHNELAIALGRGAGVAYAVTGSVAEGRVRQIAERLIGTFGSTPATTRAG